MAITVRKGFRKSDAKNPGPEWARCLLFNFDLLGDKLEHVSNQEITTVKLSLSNGYISNNGRGDIIVGGEYEKLTLNSHDLAMGNGIGEDGGNLRMEGGNIYLNNGNIYSVGTITAQKLNTHDTSLIGITSAPPAADTIDVGQMTFYWNYQTSKICIQVRDPDNGILWEAQLPTTQLELG